MHLEESDSNGEVVKAMSYEGKVEGIGHYSFREEMAARGENYL